MKRTTLHKRLAILTALCMIASFALTSILHAGAEPASVPRHPVSFHRQDGARILGVVVEEGKSLVQANSLNPEAFKPLENLKPAQQEGFVFRHWYQVDNALEGNSQKAFNLSQPITGPVQLMPVFQDVEETAEEAEEAEVLEPAEVEEPAPEAPQEEDPEVVIEVPEVEEPEVTEEPAAEEPEVVEEPAVEEPAAEEPAVEEPVVEEPEVVEEPAVEEPVVEEPEVVEEPAAEEPEVVEEPAAEEPAVEEPAVEEPVVEEPEVEESAVEEPEVVEEPAAEEPEVAEEPVVEEPAVEEPAVEEPAVEEPVVEEPAVEEPAVEEPVVEEPVVEEPVVEEPAVEEPAVEEPAAEEPEVVEEPAAEEPAAEEPVVEEPVVEDEEVSIVDLINNDEAPAAPKPAPTVKPAQKTILETPEGLEPEVDEELGVLIAEQLDELYPNRKIQIFLSWGDKEVLDFGDEIYLTARLIGYEGLTYLLRWQFLTEEEGADWQDLVRQPEELAPDFPQEKLTLILNEDTLRWSIRVQVDITDQMP